jgi:hypothetical protein
LALLTFHNFPRLLPLIYTAFSNLSLPKDGHEFQLLNYRLTQHADVIPKTTNLPALPPLPEGYTPLTAENFVSRYESCKICGDGLLSGDLLIYKCGKKGHRVQRCQMTFLPIREATDDGKDAGSGRRECGICGRHVQGVEVEAEGLVADLVRALEVCVYCGGLFIS